MMLHGNIQFTRVTLPSLAGNLLGDPSARTIPIYIPPGYRDGEPVPVVYYLPGFSGTGIGLTNFNAFEPNAFERFDRLIASGEIPPALLVGVDGFTKYGGSQYINSSLNGRYEDAIVNDLIGYVDSALSTVRAPEGRAIAGKSSGGYGALVLGMRHPDVFGTVVSHSGDVYFEDCYLPDILGALGSIQRRGGVRPFLDWIFASDPMPGDAFGGLNYIAMCAAYSPNLDSPDGIDLPLDLFTSELRPDVWKRWLAHDPVRLVDSHHRALASMRLLYFDSGDHDEYYMQFGARILSRKLTGYGVRHQFEEFDGSHRQTGHRLERSFRLIGEAFRRAD